MSQKQVSQSDNQDKQARLDYSAVAFMLKKPHCDSIERGPFRLFNRDDHRALLATAKAEQLYVWYATVVKNGDTYHVVRPHLVDWDSVPDVPYASSAIKEQAAVVEVKPSKLRCPYCDKLCFSSSGLTLHMKNKH